MRISGISKTLVLLTLNLLARSALAQPSPTPDPNGVYLAIRTDGHSGTGTEADPFDVSNSNKFDALFSAYRRDNGAFRHTRTGLCSSRGGANFDGAAQNQFDAYRAIFLPYLSHFGGQGAHFHLAAGTYQTYGWVDHFNQQGQNTVFNNTTVIGAGMGQTIIQMVNSVSRALDGNLIGNEFNDWVTNFKLQDVTLDCNGANQPKAATHLGQLSGIQARGESCAFLRVEIIGFQTFQAGVENFVAYMAQDNTNNPGKTRKNNLLDGVRIHSPANTGVVDGNTSILILGASDNGSNVVQNCTVSGIYSSYIYSHAFTADLVQFCTADNVQTAFYFEPDPGTTYAATTQRFYHNTVINCSQGLEINWAGGTSPISYVLDSNNINCNNTAITTTNVQTDNNPGIAVSIPSITLVNNTFSANPSTWANVSIGANNQTVGSLVIQNNVFVAGPAGNAMRIRRAGVTTINISGNTYANGSPANPIFY
jgi:hypothetical protein